MYLDIKLILNNNNIINIELQVTKYEFWIERSLIYLCRAFNNLSVGEDYGKVLPTYHIDILDFWLPDKTKELYSEYVLMNKRNHEIYSDKLGINVLNCTCSETSNFKCNRVMYACIYEFYYT